MSNATNVTDASPSQLGWIRQLLFERGIEMEPEEIASNSVEASAFIRRCVNGEIGEVLPITDEQAETIRVLQDALGPRPDGQETEMPTHRDGANRLIRKLNQVKFARADDTMLAKLEDLGIDVSAARAGTAEPAASTDEDELPI